RLSDRDRDRRAQAVDTSGNDRHAVDRLDLRQFGQVLLCATDVGLEARVAALNDVAGSAFTPCVAREVPVDDVPAASSEAQFDRGRVHDHRVALGDRSGELSEHVGAFGSVTEVDFDALETTPLL